MNKTLGILLIIIGNLSFIFGLIWYFLYENSNAFPWLWIIMLVCFTILEFIPGYKQKSKKNYIEFIFFLLIFAVVLLPIGTGIKVGIACLLALIANIYTIKRVLTFDPSRE